MRGKRKRLSELIATNIRIPFWEGILDWKVIPTLLTGETMPVRQMHLNKGAVTVS